MTKLVTDTGFAVDDWDSEYATLASPAANARALDLESDTDPDALDIDLSGFELIRVQFPSFADGRGFSLARRLRQLGFAGRLRAAGHVLSDQYTMARRSGFDEVEISDDLAARQGEDQWQFRANWQAHDYRQRLRA